MNIKAEVEKQMVAGIKKVLSGKNAQFDGEFVTPQMIGDHMETLGWEKGEFDTNGWQYDWWLEFSKGDKSFTASGCGHTGAFNFAATEQ